VPTLKKFLKSSLAQALAAFLLSLAIRVVYLSSRKIRHIDAGALRYMRGDANAIFAFWHGRMMLLPAFNPPKRKMHVLISRHRDGSLISQVIAHFNQATVSGSSSKGGAAAASEILQLLQNGDNISITPDGPRGPAQVAAPGVATLARLSGKAVLPVTFASSQEKRMKSWDRFAVAKPFGRIEFFVGAPITANENENDEYLRQRIERAMNQLVSAAEQAAHG
jgi:lysophospholipid acyltransferase (LPLAT)-like uncharacterized protein